MEKCLMELDNILELKIPVLVEAIKNADPITEDYGKLLTNFNSSMVVYSELKSMFARAAMEAVQNMEGENTNGTNN